MKSINLQQFNNIHIELNSLSNYNNIAFLIFFGIIVIFSIMLFTGIVFSIIYII
jgi:hypothetical protein